MERRNKELKRKLEELHKLFIKGVISRDEYIKRKKRLIKYYREHEKRFLRSITSINKFLLFILIIVFTSILLFSIYNIIGSHKEIYLINQSINHFIKDGDTYYFSIKNRDVYISRKESINKEVKGNANNPAGLINKRFIVMSSGPRIKVIKHDSTPLKSIYEYRICPDTNMSKQYIALQGVDLGSIKIRDINDKNINYEVLGSTNSLIEDWYKRKGIIKSIRKEIEEALGREVDLKKELSLIPIKNGEMYDLLSIDTNTCFYISYRSLVRSNKIIILDPAGAWWNDTWNYRRNITITELSNNNLTNYSVKIILNSSNFDFQLAKTDGSDIRFTFINSSGEEELLDYWIEEWDNNTQEALIWVKIPELLANQNKTIYLYYGNPTATSKSNPDQVFIVFTNFTREGIISAGGQDQTSDQYEVINDTALHLWGNNWKNSNVNINIQGDGTQILEAYMKATTTPEINSIGFTTSTGIGSSSNNYQFWGTQSWGLTPDKAYSTLDEWELIYAILDDFSGTFTYWVFGNDDDANKNGNVTYKNVRIRPYVNPEPSVSIGNKELAAYLVTNVSTPENATIVYRGEYFSMNGIVNCTRGDCENTSAFAQYLTTTTPLQQWIEDEKEEFDSYESIDNISISSIGELWLKPVIDWWDPRWKYRKEFNISENSGNNLYNYTIRITINATKLINEGKLNSDASDIRIIDDNNVSLDFWVEADPVYGYNYSNLSIWVKIPELLANQNKTIYLYYGNPTATSKSNPDQVFSAFANFTRDSVISAGSDQDITPTQYEVINDTALHLWGNNWKNSNVNINIQGDGTQILEAYMKATTTPELYIISVTDSISIGSTNTDYKFFGTQGWGLTPEKPYSTLDEWELIYAILDDFSGTFTYWVFGNDDDANVNGNVTFMNVRIRPYVNPEPSFIEGQEERIEFKDSGEYISNVYDIGVDNVQYEKIYWDSITNENTSIKLFTRSSQDNLSWSPWFEETNNSIIDAESYRYLQYKVVMNTSNINQSPILDKITLEYRIATSNYKDMGEGESFIASNPYNCGVLNQTQKECYPSWSVLPNNIGEFKIRIFANSTIGATTLDNDSQEVSILVYAKTFIQDFNIEPAVTTSNEYISLKAKLINDLGNPIIGQRISFFDSTNNTLLGSNVTDSNGYAYLSFIIPSSFVLGNHIVIANFSGNNSLYLAPSSSSNSFKVSSKPVINNVSVNPRIIGIGDKVTLRVNATDEVGIDKVLVNITNPKGYKETKELIEISTNIYEVNISNNWVVGNYTLIVWANNTDGIDSDTKQESFVVDSYGYSSISVEKSEYKNYENVLLNSTLNSWWNLSWKYRRKIVVDGKSEDLDQYQVRLIINTSELINENKLNSDCSDLRFTAVTQYYELPLTITNDLGEDINGPVKIKITDTSIINHLGDGSSLRIYESRSDDPYFTPYQGVSFFIEEVGSEDAIIWVNLNLSSGSSKTLYLYYGKEASSVSNYKAVFNEFIGETGIIAVNSSWQWISFSNSYTEIPAVIASIISTNDASPVVVRIKDVNKTGFYIRLQESTSLDDLHGFENVSYMVIKKGIHYMGDKLVIVNTTAIDNPSGNTYQTITLPISFDSNPVVISSINTYNEADEVHTRENNIATNSFAVKLEEETDSSHGLENVSWIAISDGFSLDMGFSKLFAGILQTTDTWALIGATNVNSALGQLETENGGDNSFARLRRDGNSFDIHVEEENNYDGAHTTETMGWIAWSNSSMELYATNKTYSPTISFGSENSFIAGEKKIPYFIESGCNSTNTSIVIRSEEIPANGDAIIYMYYGNPSASSESSELSIYTYDYPVPLYVPIGSNNIDTADVTSYINNNTISYGSVQTNINYREIQQLSSFSQNSVVKAKGPLQIESQSTGDAFIPISFAGTMFVYRIDRGTNTYYFYAPFNDSKVEICYGIGFTNCTENITIAKGQVSQSTIDTPNDVTVRFNATNPVLIFHQGGSNDNFPLYPASNDWYGTGSNYLEIGILEDNTQITIYYSDGTIASQSGTYNAGDQLYIATPSTSDGSSEGADVGVHVVSDKPIGVDQHADSDGVETTTFLPEWELSNEYLIPQNAQYIAVTTVVPNTNCTLYYSDGTTQTKSSQSNAYPYPGKIYFGSTSDGSNIPISSNATLLKCDAPVMAYYEEASTNDEHNLWNIKQAKRWPEYNFSYTIFNEETSTSGIKNIGYTNISGYLYMIVQKLSSGWNDLPPPVVYDTSVRIVRPGETLNVSKIWIDSGAWNTLDNLPGRYRVYMEFRDSNGNPLVMSDGTILSGFSEFIIKEAELRLTNITHENLYEENINEYEASDVIDWVNVTVQALNNTAINAIVNLTLIDSSGEYANFGPNSAKSCGNIPENSYCTLMWNNDSYGYPIPLNIPSGSYTFYWDVFMNMSNGVAKENNSLNLIIHNIPSTFNASLSKSRIYIGGNGTNYTFTFTNLWSVNITNVSVKMNLPRNVGLSANCSGNGDLCIIGDVASKVNSSSIFTIIANDTAIAGDYWVNVTLNYSNPRENKSWVEIKPLLLEVRNQGILEINVEDYPQKITRGENNLWIHAFINNTGDNNASNASMNYTLPQGFVNNTELLKKTDILEPSQIMWHNLSFNVSLLSSLGENIIRINSWSNEGQEDFKNLYVYVYANSSIDGLSLNDTNASRYETVRITAHLIYDNGSPIINEPIEFIDLTDNKIIGSAYTNSGGYAYIDYYLDDSTSLGLHEIIANYSGSASLFTNPSNSSIYLDVGLKPVINDFFAYPERQGYDFNVTLYANVSDDDSIDKVFSFIEYPNSTIKKVNMTLNLSSGLYYYVFTTPWLSGNYSFHIWVNDTTGSFSISEKKNFSVEVSATIQVETINKSYGQNEIVLLKQGPSTPWWNSEWRYRKIINITDTSGFNYSVTDVKIVINTSELINENKLNSDCSDLRFIEESREIPFYIESGCNTSNTVIWIRIYNLTSSNTLSIEMYYGNSLASSVNLSKDNFFERMVVGHLNVPAQDSDQWYSVTMPITFNEKPVIIAEPDETYSGSQEMVWRLKDITTNSFSIRQEEPSNRDDYHAAEEVSYIAIPVGDWLTIGGDVRIKSLREITDKWEEGDGDTWDSRNNYSLYPNFTSAPVVLPQLQEFSEYQNYAEVRLHNISNDYFEFAPEPEGDVLTAPNDNVTIGFLIVEQHVGTIDGSVKSETGSISVTDSFTTASFSSSFANAPRILAWMQTYNGGDAATVRGDNLGTTSIKFAIQEDISYDSETSHSAETVSWFAIEQSGTYYLRHFIESDPIINISNEETTGSSISNIGDTPIKGFLLMSVEKNTSFGWELLNVVVNESTERIINPRSVLDLSTIWQSNGGWNTTNNAPGVYRVNASLLDPYGRIISTTTGIINNYGYFNITPPPINISMDIIKIYDVTDSLNTHTYSINLTDEGLNKTFIVTKDRIYRVEVWISNANDSWPWEINKSIVKYLGLSTNWSIDEVNDIWYNNGSIDFTGGSWNGNVTWNTSLGGVVVNGSKAMFSFVINFSNTTGEFPVNFLINDPQFIISDSSIFKVVSSDNTPPGIVDSTYNLSTTKVIRGNSLLIHAQWDEELSNATVEFNSTSPLVYTYYIDPPYTDNWTNYTINTNSLWLLGIHVAKLSAADLLGNWNNSLPYLPFEVWGLARISDGSYSSNNINVGETINISCRVVDVTNSEAISNYVVYFYNSTSLIGTNTTNSSGWASISYTDYSPGKENITCNITNDPQRFYDVDIYNSYVFELTTKESNPPWWSSQSSDKSLVHKTELVTFRTFWMDDYLLSEAILSINYTKHDGSDGWINISSLSLEGNESWVNISINIPQDMAPGKLYWKQYGIDSFNNSNVTDVLNITVWGWSGIDYISLNPANIQVSNKTIIKCHVIDINDSFNLSNYVVYFYNSTSLLGTNTTGVDGYAYYTYIDNTPGDENITCSINDNALLMYNVSVDHKNLTTLLHTVTGSDATPPGLVNNNYGLNDSSVKKGESLLIYAQWDESINNSYVLMNTTNSNIEQYYIEPPYINNWTNYTINTNSSWIVGRHVAKIIATDQAGNTNNSLDYLWFNVTATSRADWYSPTGVVKAGFINVSCKVTEEENGQGINDYPVYFYDPSNNLIGINYTNSSGIASIAYNASNLSGYNTFSCRIYSEPELFYYIGYSYSDSEQIYIDKYGPSIVLNYPADNAVINDLYVNFNWTATDDTSTNLKCNLTLNGILRATTNCVSGTACNYTLKLSTGKYYWNVSCSDEYNHVNVSETRVLNIVSPDSNPPIIKLISPENNTITNNASIVFYFNVSDESSIDNCSLIIDGNINNTKTEIVIGENNITGNGFSEGSHNWSIKCIDYYGNEGFSNESIIIIDYTLPSSFYLIGPANNTISRDTLVEFNWSQSSDEHFYGYRLEISNSSDFSTILYSYLTIGVDNTSINVTLDNDGDWWWRVIAIDSAKNERQSNEEWLYVTDNTAPIVTLLSPPNNDNDPDGNITFYYSLTEKHPETCYLYTNHTGVWQVVDSQQAVNGWNSFELYNIPLGTVFIWNVKCVDNVSLSSFAPSNWTVRVTNETSYYQNITINTNASVNNTPGYVSQIFIDQDIDLIAGSTTPVECNATISDDNGVDDLIGARAVIYSHNSFVDAVDNETNHYSNDSCDCVRINDLQMSCKCGFNVQYFADNGSWNCSVTAISVDGNTSSEYSFNINPLLAITVDPYIINYGNVGAGSSSVDRPLSIINYGNVMIDLNGFAFVNDLSDGLAMNCSSGNISSDNERFSFSSGSLFDEMTPIGSYSSMSIIDLNLSRTINSSINSSKSLWFKVFVPDTVSGECSGHMVLIATPNS